MAAREPRLRGSRGSGALGPAVVLAAALLAGAVTRPVSHAQSAPDLVRAKDLYRSAETAMQDSRFDDAARDYGAAYELSKDPALFFKIGRANERGGKCEIALIYYARYLREGKPTEQFAALTRERIAACGGDVHGVDGSQAAGPGSAGSAGSADSGAAPVPAGPGSAGRGSATGSAGSAASSAAAPDSGAGPGIAGPGSAASAGVGSAAAGSATSEAGNQGSAAGSGSASPLLIPNNQQKVAWLMSGSAIALATLGGVLAYAARSSENDVRDLYLGFAGQVPVFDGQTRKRYDDLIDQGRRYQHLSWAAFGVAGAAAVGAALLFTLGSGESAQPARIAPLVTTRSAGVSIRF